MPLPNILSGPRAPFVVVLAAGLGFFWGGVAMAELLRLAACPLCIIQRMLYLLLAAVAGLGLLASGSAGRRAAALGMAAVAGTGAFVAGYQVWIQRFARGVSCTGDEPWWERFVNWAGEQAPLLFQPNGLCSDPAWKLLGLSIAEWSLLAFSVLLVYSLRTLFRRC